MSSSKVTTSNYLYLLCADGTVDCRPPEPLGLGSVGSGGIGLGRVKLDRVGLGLGWDGSWMDWARVGLGVVCGSSYVGGSGGGEWVGRRCRDTTDRAASAGGFLL